MSLGASIAYRIGLEGAEDVRSKLDAVGASGERAGQRLSRSVEETKAPFEAVTRSVEGLRTNLSDLLPAMGALAETGVAAGMLELAKGAAEATRALSNQATAFGLSTEELEKWKYAATQVGVSEESFVRGMQRFVAGLGQAREAEEKLRENAGLLVEAQQLAESKATEARDAASQSADRAREAITRSNTAYQEAQLTLRKSSEAYDRLRVSAGGFYQAIPIGTLATDKSVIAHQRLAEAQETVDINTRKLAQAQAGIADAVRAANLEQERQLNLSKQQALEQDKAARAAMKEQGGTLGAYQKLGLDPEQLGDTDQALQKTLAALEKIGDATQRAAIMKQLWGKGWAESAALIQLNQADLEKLGLQLVGVTEEEKRFADDFNKSWSRLSNTLEGVKNAVGNILGQAFAPVFNAISDFFLHNASTIRSWAEGITSGFMAVGRVVHGFFDQIALLVNFWRTGLAKTVFSGNDITGSGLLVGLGLASAAFAAVVLQIKAFALAIRVLELGKLATGIGAVVTAIGRATVAMATWGKNFIEFAGIVARGLAPMLLAMGPAGWILVGIGAVAVAILTWKGAWGPIFKFLGEGFDNLINTVKAFYKLVETAYQAAARLFGIPKLTSEEAPAQHQDVGRSFTPEEISRNEQEHPEVYGHAAGGLIRGPGTGTSDSIFARLSDGEFVVRAAATRMWLPVLEAINSSGSTIAGALSTSIHRRRFADGGLVLAGDSGAGSLSALPRELLAAGGFAAVNVRFEIAGKTFPMRSKRETAAELIATAREQKLLSAGRQQSWKTE